MALDSDCFDVSVYLLTQETRTMFVDQLQTSQAFRKAHSMLGSNFVIIFHLVSKVL
jgi:hypothetical protein